VLVPPTESVPADPQVGVSRPSTRGASTGVDDSAGTRDERSVGPVLLAEDDLKFAQLLVRVFARAGIDSVHTSTGDEALRVMQSGTEFRAAVLDVMIPHPDGLEVCRHLQRLTPELPVLAISARTGTQHRARALAAGADVFLEKPFALHDLMSLTASLVIRPSQETP